MAIQVQVLCLLIVAILISFMCGAAWNIFYQLKSYNDLSKRQREFYEAIIAYYQKILMEKAQDAEK